MGEARRRRVQGRPTVEAPRPPGSVVDRAMAEATLRELAEYLTKELPGGVGFVITLFNFTDDADADARWSTYASNAQRPDVITYLDELAGHLRTGENKVPMVGVPDPASENS